VPNNGWMASGPNAVNTLTVSNGGLPVGGLLTQADAPNNCITISLDLTISCGDPVDLIGYAELTGHRDVFDNLDDIDSTPGSDSPDERSVLPGDVFDNSFNDINEDDHDPATMPLVDVALITTLDLSNPIAYGQPVIFNVQVVNQGNVDLTNVEITDYIPCGFAYDTSNNPLWSQVGSNAITSIASLDVDESVDISLSLILLESSNVCTHDIAWLNETEVSELFDDALVDVSLQDFDSRSNNILGDDAGGAANTSSDNSLIGNGTGAVLDIFAETDEDDHDPSLLDVYDLSLEKSVTSSGPYGQDSLVMYEIILTNEGNLIASSIQVSDIPEMGLNFVSSDANLNPNVVETGTGIWVVGSLAPGLSDTINATFVVTNNFQGLLLTNSVEITMDDGDDVDSDPNMSFDNDENGDGNPDDDDEDSADIDLVQFYDLSLMKTEVSTGPYEQNDQIVYEITVINEGTLNANNIQFVDMPGNGLEFVSDNSSTNANVSAVGPLEYQINVLDFGDSESITLTFRVNSLYQDTLIANSAQIIQDDGNDRDSNPDSGPDVDENGDGDGDDDDEDIIILDVLQTYDLSLSKTVISSGPYVPGSFITYRISVLNEGSLNANNIEFMDSPAAGLSFVSDNSNLNPNVLLISTGLYRINTLNFGLTESIDLVYQIDPDYQDFDIGNSAELTNDDGDDQDSDPDEGPDVDDNDDGDLDDDDEDETITDVVQVYDLSIEKELVNINPIFPGDDVTFLITITNSGTLDAEDIEITENPAPEMIFISSNAMSNVNVTEVNDDLYLLTSLPHGTTETFEVTYNIPLDYLVPSIDNNVEITLDDGDDQDSDPNTSFDVDEDGDGDGYDDDEALLMIPVIIGYDLGDFVWHDLDGDGVQDTNEPGLEGVFVRLYNSLGFLIDVQVTDGNGFYLFEEVFPGNYFIGVDLVDDFESTLADIGNNDLLDNDLTDQNGEGTTSVFTLSDDDLSIDLGLMQCAEIGQTVWFDYNENDLEDPTENGINGMRVELFRFEPLGWTLYDFQFTGLEPGTPSDDGFFKFCVRPGRYYLRFINPPETLVPASPNRGNDNFDSDLTNRFGPGTTDEIIVLSGDEVCNISAGYYPMGTIGDFIWMDENHNGMRDNNEGGIEGIVIRAINTQGIEVQSTTSNEDGSYILDYLPKDNYYLEVTPPLGMVVSLSNVGSDDTVDSDIDGTNGINTTKLFQVTPGNHTGNVDIGLVFGVLPVEWIDIWGEQKGNFNFIEWTVASETNVSHYEILRKDQGNDKWVSVGDVDFKSPTSHQNVYSFNDYAISQSEFVNYQVKQVDLNGSISLSKVILIKTNDFNENTPSISIYPNPAVSEVKIMLESPFDVVNFKVDIFNQSGLLIRKNIIDVHNQSSGLNEYDLNITDMTPGVYTVKLDIDDFQIIEKIVVLK